MEGSFGIPFHRASREGPSRARRVCPLAHRDAVSLIDGSAFCLPIKMGEFEKVLFEVLF